MMKRLALFVGIFAIFFVPVVWILNTRHPTPKTQNQRALMPDQPIQAAAFRYFQRLSEDGKIPENAWVKAKAQRDALLRDQMAGIYPASWSWLGPGNIGGRIRAILIDPNNPNVMWTGTASGGIWKTTNGGSQWLPLDDFIPGLAVGSMALDPVNSNVLYAGTGEGFAEWPEGTSNTAFIRGAGIYKSTDGGDSWDPLPSTVNPDFYFVNRIAISPTDPNLLLAATGTGIWRSTNAGQTWALVRVGFTYDVKFHPTDAQKAIAGLHDDGAVFSTNGGLSWNASTGITAHRTELAYSRSNPSIIYASVSNNDLIKIYRSTDGGLTFALRSVGAGISTYSAYNNTLWVDPTNSDTLIFGGVSLYRSIDGGANQSAVFNAVHSDMHVIVNHPQFNGSTNKTVLFGTDGGIYRTTDAYGTAATALNNNLGVTQFYGAVVNPISGIAFGGTQDNGTLRYSGNPQTWTHPFGGDGGYAATDPTDPNFFYGETQYANVFRSTNGGTSGSTIIQGVTDAGTLNSNFIPYFMLDPNDPNRMLLGCRRLWRTNNVKTGAPPTWTAIKPTIEPTDGEPPKSHFLGNSPYNISTMAVAQGNPDLIYVGHNNGQVWKTVNGTAATPTWTRVDDVAGPMPLRWVSKIVIDPNNTNRVYVAFMGWEPDNIWRTIDGGTNWSSISGSGLSAFPSLPTSALAIHPTEPGWLYAGTDLGLFTSVDDGATWNTSNQGPALVPVEELHWVNAQTLLAVTHGRGLYRATVNTGQDPNSPTSFRIATGRPRKAQLPLLYFSDDRRVVVDDDPVNEFQYPVLIEFTSQVSFANPSQLRFAVESSGSSPELGMQTWLFNFQTNRWVALDLRSVTLSDTLAQVSVSANPAAFVNPAPPHGVRARVGWSALTADISSPWTVNVDQVFWTAIR